MQLFILDRNENLAAILNSDISKSGAHFFDSVHTKEINRGSELTFYVDARDEVAAQHVKEENYVVFKDGDIYRLLIIKEIGDTHDVTLRREVYCQDAYLELYDEPIFNDFDSTAAIELSDAVETVLKNTRWSVGECTNTYAHKITQSVKNGTVLSALNTIASIYDVEVEFYVDFVGNKIVSRRVSMRRQVGRSLGKRLEYSKDITKISRIINTSDIKTAIVPFGKEDEETGEVLTIASVQLKEDVDGFNKPIGQTYLEDRTATELWGYPGADGERRPRWLVVSYPEVESASELLNYAKMQLARFNTPKITYQVEAVDLYKMIGDESLSFERVEIGDTVAIIDHDFTPPLKLTSRVVKIEETLNSNNPNTVITLGNVIESIVDKDLKTQIEELRVNVSSVAASSSVDLSDIHDRLENLEDKTGAGVWDQVQEINNILFSSTSGYYYMDNGDGIWVYDKPINGRPKKALALKGGALGIASWDDQRQAWNVGTFIDGNQVNASYINTGTLSADRIKAGSITAEKLEISTRNKINNAVNFEEVSTEIKAQLGKFETEISKKYVTDETVNKKLENLEIGSRNYVRDYTFKKADVWKCYTKNAVVDTVNNCGELNASPLNPYLYQEFNSGLFKTGDTLTLQYYIKAVGVAENTGSDSLLLCTLLTAYENESNTYLGDVATFGKHEGEVDTLGDWTLVTKTITINTDFINYYTRLRLYARNFTGVIYFKDVKLVRGSKAIDVGAAPEDFTIEIDDIKENITDFENTINTSFKDSIISSAESLAIKQQINTLNAVKSEVDKEYTAVIGNYVLSTSLKNTLKTKKTSFDTAHTTLINTINSAINDSGIEDAERTAVDSAFTSYNSALGEYKAALQNCLDNISTAKVDNIVIGGANLYVRTKVINRDDWHNISFYDTAEEYNGFTVFKRTGTWQGLSQDYAYIQGETYTLSVYAKGNGTSDLHFYHQGSATNVKRSFTQGTILPTGWVRYYVTFTIGADFSRPRFENSKDGGVIYFYAHKLELGTKNTDWTPSNEDLVQAETLNDKLQGLIDQTQDLYKNYENLISDKKLTPSEKIKLKTELAQMRTQYEAIAEVVAALNNPTLDSMKTDLYSKYTAANTTLEPYLKDLTTIQDADEETIYTLMADFYKEYEVLLASIQKLLNTTIVQNSTSITQLEKSVTIAITNAETSLGVTNLITKHFEFNAGGIEIYARDSNGNKGRFSTKISEEKLAFHDGGNEVAYLSNQELYITRANILDSLQVNSIAMVKTAKGGIMFKWNGN